MFSINGKDVSKAIVMAVLTGIAVPVVAVIQTPGFDIFTANWQVICTLALNGALSGFGGYILKNFFSNEQGQVFGKIG